MTPPVSVRCAARRASFRRLWSIATCSVGILCGVDGCAPAHAQQRETVAVDLAFYGDNTEFANPFREGETLLGVSGRIVLNVEVSDRVTVVGGVFGNERFGAARAFEQVRPVLALAIAGPRQRFVFGTLVASQPGPFGPDRHNQHGLLPPLQGETLAFTRRWEAGLQWTTNAPRLSQDVWLNWQQVNTDRHRERFDTGVVGALRVRDGAWLNYQGHLVHRGGQLFASGPVADSYAVAIGGRAARQLPGLDELSVEGWGLVSRDVPDRARASASRTGRALLARAEGVRSHWRVHGLLFRGDAFVKEEGDPNYQAVRRDGRPFTKVRDYSEIGLARRFPVAPGVTLEAAFRLHRTEAYYEYSYRIIGRTKLAWALR